MVFCVVVDSCFLGFFLLESINVQGQLQKYVVTAVCVIMSGFCILVVKVRMVSLIRHIYYSIIDPVVRLGAVLSVRLGNSIQ